MDRWKEYSAGKLSLPAIVQSDVSGVLVATKDGFRGPFVEVKGADDKYYLGLAAQPFPVAEPDEDYRVKYETLQKAVDSISTDDSKATIVSALASIKTTKAKEAR